MVEYADGPVEIAPGTYWVGSADKELLKRNSFVRVFRGNDRSFSVLIDPGAPVDLECVVGNTMKIVGKLENLHVVFANHQDPDVIGNAPYLFKYNPKLLFLMSEDTWRLVQYYGIPKTNFMGVEQFPDFKVPLSTGQSLQFIPTPFCHFRGACMLYDTETRVLFSGDLFGGIAAPGLAATPGSWAGIKAFHELYMPSNQALRLAVKRIRELSPPPLMIAPQHGSLITGGLIGQFLDRMNDLTVGLDIIQPLEGKHQSILQAINEILKAARDIIGSDGVSRVLSLYRPDGSYPAIFSVSQNETVTDIKAEPIASVSSLAKMLFKECPDDQKRPLQLRILVILVEQGLPPIESAIEWEESLKAGPL